LNGSGCKKRLQASLRDCTRNHTSTIARYLVL
jgi:hypothetical protein